MRDKVWERIMIILGIIVVVMITSIVFMQSRHQSIDCEKVLNMSMQDKSYMPAYEKCKDERRKNNGM